MEKDYRDISISFCSKDLLLSKNSLSLWTSLILAHSAQLAQSAEFYFLISYIKVRIGLAWAAFAKLNIKVTEDQT